VLRAIGALGGFLILAVVILRCELLSIHAFKTKGPARSLPQAHRWNATAPDQNELHAALLITPELVDLDSLRSLSSIHSVQFPHFHKAVEALTSGIGRDVRTDV
jgi:hypothetical protein